MTKTSRLYVATIPASPTGNVCHRGLTALARKLEVRVSAIMGGHAAQTARQAATSSIASAGMSPVSTPCVRGERKEHVSLGEGFHDHQPGRDGDQ